MKVITPGDVLLRVDQLTIGYRTPRGSYEAVRNVTLEITPGQIFGVVGESGSGKSTLALAIMHYLPANGHIQQGSIHFQGRDLSRIDQDDMRRIWGAELGLVPQDPSSALNPSIRIGEQIAEVLRRHQGLDERDAAALSMEWIEKVRLPDPKQVIGSYPHQLSGGMQQRVMIAMALCTKPKLLMLDEPTTNLDATTQATILDLLCELMEAQQTAAMYITHNLGVVAQICDELAVLYAGEVVEQGSTQDLFSYPLHPYTRGLLDSVPRLGRSKRQLRLHAIQGRIPSMDARPSGCIFRERCPLVIDICEEEPPLYAVNDGRGSRCHRWEEIVRGDIDAGQRSDSRRRYTDSVLDKQISLDVRGLHVQFDRERSLFARLGKRAGGSIKAVNDVSFEIRSGETLGFVGESGSGKTTAARAILGLVIPEEGEIVVQGKRLAPGLRDRTLEERRLVQMVFQNPYEAFNPYLTVGEALSRPLIRLLKIPHHQVAQEVGRLLESVQLPANYATRLPGSLSGGERQRVAIARAFASSPELLLADEAVSALDVSVQATILNLLGEMQAESGSATLFISHDLAAVGYVADRIAVIYLGELMELSYSEELFQPPYHPYTEALLSAIPLLDPAAQKERIRLEGDLPSPTEVRAGCPFESRCPRRIGEICRTVIPPWLEGPHGTQIYCHIPIDELDRLQSQVFQFSTQGGEER
jgi:peptide/nickel transport system ATP-binding protein